jgi:3-oxoacyl-[acyl-carrier protein] reductase
MLNDQVVLVTGASRGIGQAIARALGAAQATVIGTATSQAGADSISSTFAENGVKGTGMVLDVGNAESIANCMKQLKDAYGAPDILVNNAGITRDNLLMKMSDEQWDEIINTNLSSVFRMSKAVVRAMMKKRSGRIINISSGSRNITVNTVAPGFIDTDMTRELAEEQRSALAAQIPLGRLGSAEEVAATVVFLASPAAAYITGETIHVNGGMYMA